MKDENAKRQTRITQLFNRCLKASPIRFHKLIWVSSSSILWFSSKNCSSSSRDNRRSCVTPQASNISSLSALLLSYLRRTLRQFAIFFCSTASFVFFSSVLFRKIKETIIRQTADTTARTAKRINAGRVPQKSSIAMVSIATKVSAVCIFHLLCAQPGKLRLGFRYPGYL